MDSKAQMRRNYQSMRRMQTIEQEDITLQKKIKEQYEKAHINHATLQYQKKLEKYRMHQLASQMKNLENNPTDSKKRKQKKPQKMTSLMAIEAEKQSQNEKQNDEVETMVGCDSKPKSDGKMGFLFQSNDIDDLVNSFCSKLKSKKKDSLQYPGTSFTRKNASLDEFISQQTSGSSQHGRPSYIGIAENERDSQKHTPYSRIDRDPSRGHSSSTSPIGVQELTELENNTLHNTDNNTKSDNIKRIAKVGGEHGYSRKITDKIKSLKSQTITSSINISSVPNSERKPVRVENSRKAHNSVIPSGHQTESINPLHIKPKTTPSSINSHPNKLESAVYPSKSPELTENSAVTDGSDSGISSSSSNANHETSNRLVDTNSDKSGSPQKKDPVASDISSDQVHTRGIPLKDIVAKKHRKKVPEGVKVKHCWVGDPEAINSIRRPIMSPHEKLLKQLVHRAMERKQEQANKSNNQTLSEAPGATNSDTGNTPVKTKKTKKVKRSELDTSKEPSSNPYPVFFQHGNTHSSDTAANKQQPSQTSRAYVEKGQSKHNTGSFYDGVTAATKKRPFSAPVLKQPPPDTSHVVALQDQFKVDISGAVFKKDGSSRKSPSKPKHLSSKSYTPSSNIWPTIDEVSHTSHTESPIYRPATSSASSSAPQTQSDHSSKETHLSRPHTGKRSVHRSLTQPTFSSLQKLSKDGSNAKPPPGSINSVKRSHTTVAACKRSSKRASVGRVQQAHNGRSHRTDAGVIRIPCAIDEEEVSLV